MPTLKPPLKWITAALDFWMISRGTDHPDTKNSAAVSMAQCSLVVDANQYFDAVGLAALLSFARPLIAPSPTVTDAGGLSETERMLLAAVGALLVLTFAYTLTWAAVVVRLSCPHRCARCASPEASPGAPPAACL